MKEININDIEVLWDKDSINKQVKRVAQEINSKFISEKSVNLIPIMTGGLMFVSNLIAELEILRSGCYHMFPLIAKDGGVLQRAGHTEASVDLCKLANLPPAALIVEIVDEDGTMARGEKLIEIANKYKMSIISVQDLI